MVRGFEACVRPVNLWLFKRLTGELSAPENAQRPVAVRTGSLCLAMESACCAVTAAFCGRLGMQMHCAQSL